MNLILLAICAFSFHGRNIGETVVARRYVLSGPAGQVLAELSLSEIGQPQFMMNSDGGRGSIQMVFDDAGSPRIGLFGTGDAPLLEVGLHLGLSPVFVMRDEELRRRFAVVGTGAAGTSMRFYDSNGIDRIKLATDEKDCPCLTLKNQDDVVRASVRTFDDKAVGVDLFDLSGKARSAFQVDANGVADVSLLDVNGSPLWSARAYSN